MKRVSELDGLRAAAILGVVAWHYIGAGDGSDLLTWQIFHVGRAGVDLFFVMSGYLITRILLDHTSSANFFSTFYGRRATRILPIYFVMVAIFLAGRQLNWHLLCDGALPWWSYLFGLQNIWMAIDQNYGAPMLAATWSLAIEEQFYLFFPLVVRLMPNRLPWLLLTLMIVCPIARVACGLAGDAYGYYVLMPLRADVLAVGALIAWLEAFRQVTPTMRRVITMIFWSAVAFFPIFAWAIPATDWVNAVWGHAYLTVLFGSMLFVVLQNQGATKFAFLRSDIAAYFARISYALYLVHMPIILLFSSAAGLRGGHTILTFQGALVTTLAFLASLAICNASHRWLEGPMIRYGHERFRF